MKRQAVAYWEIIFANAIFNKRLVSRMYKLSKLNNKKIANYEKFSKILKNISPKKIYGYQIHEKCWQEVKQLKLSYAAGVNVKSL